MSVWHLIQNKCQMYCILNIMINTFHVSAHLFFIKASKSTTTNNLYFTDEKSQGL